MVLKYFSHIGFALNSTKIEMTIIKNRKYFKITVSFCIYTILYLTLENSMGFESELSMLLSYKDIGCLTGDSNLENFI